MSDNDVVVRPIDELDVEGISAVDEAVSGKYRPEIWETRVVYYIRRDPEGSFVATVGDDVVGFMFGEVRSGEFGLEEPTGWIEVLGVHPDQRGKAIGRKLAEAMLARFRSRGATSVRTLVDQSQAGIASYFEALGFAPEPRQVYARILE